ncbi:hypothetical protein [Candidatus Sororendozoicomonas aggregata]|uniref:hypothetical protein n=1 Tax=Candidatus Sororendozoicomonas aggregata TaxID=3073239 RepID=UPI002ED3C4F0
MRRIIYLIFTTLLFSIPPAFADFTVKNNSGQSVQIKLFVFSGFEEYPLAFNVAANSQQTLGASDAYAVSIDTQFQGKKLSFFPWKGPIRSRDVFKDFVLTIDQSGKISQCTFKPDPKYNGCETMKAGGAGGSCDPNAKYNPYESPYLYPCDYTPAARVSK